MKTLNEFRAICQRSHETLLPDALGAVSLCVMLVVALHIPSFL